MTKDEWLQVQDKLSHPWGSVKLTVDSYALTLQVRQIKPLKYTIMVYVDGEFKGEWMNGEADQAKRFLRPVKSYLYSPAKQKALLKGLSKAQAKIRAEFLCFDKTWCHYEPLWPSFGPLKRHLISNNKSIELAPPTPDELEIKALEKQVIDGLEELEG